MDSALQGLQAKGVQLAVLSDSDPRLHDILQALEVRHYFTYIGCSYDSGIWG